MNLSADDQLHAVWNIVQHHISQAAQGWGCCNQHQIDFPAQQAEFYDPTPLQQLRIDLDNKK